MCILYYGLYKLSLMLCFLSHFSLYIIYDDFTVRKNVKLCTISYLILKGKVFVIIKTKPYWMDLSPVFCLCFWKKQTIQRSGHAVIN